MDEQFQRNFQHIFWFAVAKHFTMEPGQIMPESAVQWFDLGGEGLSRVMLGVWDEILVGLQQVRAIAHRRQVLDLLPENSTGFDHPSSTDKA